MSGQARLDTCGSNVTTKDYGRTMHGSKRHFEYGTVVVIHKKELKLTEAGDEKTQAGDEEEEEGEEEEGDDREEEHEVLKIFGREEGATIMRVRFLRNTVRSSARRAEFVELLGAIEDSARRGLSPPDRCQAIDDIEALAPATDKIRKTKAMLDSMLQQASCSTMNYSAGLQHCQDACHAMRLQGRVNKLQTSLSGLKERYQEAERGHNAKIKALIATHAQDINELDGDREQLRVLLERRDGIIKDLQGKVQSLEDQASALTDAHARTSSGLEASLQGYRSRLREAMADLMMWKRENYRLTEELQATKKETTAQQEALDRSHGITNNLQADVQGYRRRLRESLADSTITKQENERLTEELQAALGRADHLQTELERSHYEADLANETADCWQRQCLEIRHVIEYAISVVVEYAISNGHDKGRKSSIAAKSPVPLVPLPTP